MMLSCAVCDAVESAVCDAVMSAVCDTESDVCDAVMCAVCRCTQRWLRAVVFWPKSWTSCPPCSS